MSPSSGWLNPAEALAFELLLSSHMINVSLYAAVTGDNSAAKMTQWLEQ